MIERNRILVVGTGLFGSVVARELAELGYPITIIDKRSHIAGNCYDFIHESGIRIHKYGPHIFHTSNTKVFNWLSRFTEWIDYEHLVAAKLESGKLVPFPPNSKTLEYVEADKLIDTFYKPYTEKMWAMKLSDVNNRIIKRVPIREGDEDRYFPNDVYQKLPYRGYTALMESVLDHPLIEIKLDYPFRKGTEANFLHTFNSMAIDEFFNYEFGHLPYRSIKFITSVAKKERNSNYPVINFTDNSPYTRVTEWKNFPNHGVNPDATVMTKEQPCDYKDNNLERYYPVIDKSGKNRKLYKSYLKNTPENMTFIGRCGMYAYINMDQAVSSALAVVADFKKNKRKV